MERSRSDDEGQPRGFLGLRGVAARLRLGVATVVVAVAVVVVVLSVSGGRPSSAKTRPSTTLRNGPARLVRSQFGSTTTGGGWLPASDVSGDHQSPGASDCAPQTTSGSESASALEAGASQVASGTVGGLAWSLWSKQGESGADGLEEGGVVVDGTAYGLCPGFPNPAEMELLEPSGGGDAIAYGVIGYAGSAKVAIYQDTFGNFATGTLLASTTAQSVNGVGFFITTLSSSGCDIPAVEMNTASASDATEHNLGFSTSDCTDGQLVPISNSQGIWALPTSDYPDKFGSANGGGAQLAPLYDSHKLARILFARYRILRTRRVAPATLPLPVQRMVSRTGARLGLDTSDIARVQPAPGVTMWLIRGISGACGFEFDKGGGAGSCGRIHNGLGPSTTGGDPTVRSRKASRQTA